MDLGAFNQWLSVIALLLSIGNGAWIWVSRPARDLGKRIDDVSESVDDAFDGLKGHDRRIQRVEDDLRHLPTKADLHKIEMSQTSMKTELDTIARVVNRIDDFLRADR